MKLKFAIIRFVFFVMLFSLTSSLNATNSIQVYTRNCISLNGQWHIIVDPYENGYYNYRYEAFDKNENPGTGAYFTDAEKKSPSDLIEYNFDKSPTLNVPGDWNTQDPKLYYYEGTVWYRNKFDAPVIEQGSRVFLYFGAVNYKAEVYLNAKKLGTHIGGFTPFNFEITGLFKEKDNSLVVKVDNKRTKEGVPTLNTDWWNYGGITREVKIVVVPKTFIRDYFVKLESLETRKISGFVILDGAAANTEVSVSIPELKVKEKVLCDAEGKAIYSFIAKNIELWSPSDPKRYRIEIAAVNDKFVDSVGFRTISTQGKQILLNGKPVFLRGISVHDEYAVDGGGRVNAAWKAEKLLNWAKELNCNFVRLAHYPHSEDMVRLADKKGILVWSEIPVYWTIDWENEGTYQNAQNQLTENILRDKNRAAIIIWSLANETPVGNARTQFLTRLATYARELDNSRLISLAMEKHTSPDKPGVAIVQDPLADIVDIISFNEYVGWYDGLPDKCSTITWEIPYDKPVFISEFGGDAKYGYHGDILTRFTEEYQENLYVKSLEMLGKIDGLSGMSPWILVDFRSPRRVLPGIQDDFNRKGLYSQDGKKKKAFFVLQDFYNNMKSESGKVK
jgi:beta-glucuronidase